MQHPTTQPKPTPQAQNLDKVVRYRCDAPLVQTFDQSVARSGKNRSQVLRELMLGWVAREDQRQSA